VLTSWVLGQQIQNSRQTLGRFRTAENDDFYLFIPGLLGSSMRKGQSGKVEVSLVSFEGYYWFKDRPVTWDPSFKFTVECWIRTGLDLPALESLARKNEIVPATITHVSKSGKMTHVVVMGESRLFVDPPGQLSSMGRLVFECRRLHITPPPLT
jgi:hypothetical protein